MPRRKKSEMDIRTIKKIKTPELLKGVKDGLPIEEKFWLYLQDHLLQIAKDYTFNYINLPGIERMELLAHTLGKNTKAIKKSINFLAKNEKVILPPDFMPSFARAYIGHNLGNQSSLVKLFSMNKVFRQDENEYFGKLRQANEFSMAIFGGKYGNTEGELIYIIYHLIKRLKGDAIVDLNSVGCLECIDNYEKTLVNYYKPKRTSLCNRCKKSLLKNPLALLQCTNARCEKMREDAPPIVDWLCQSCKDHFFKVVECLDDLQVPYKLNPWLVKEFEYQNRTIFEIRFFNPEKKEEDQKKILLARGARFDYLTEMIGAEQVAGVGVGLMMGKLIKLMRENKIESPEKPEVDVYLAQLAEGAKRKAMLFFEELREETYVVKANFTRNSLKSQLEQAKKVGAKIVLILAQKEMTEGTIIIRDVDSGVQEVINFDKVKDEVKRKLAEIKKRKR